MGALQWIQYGKPNTFMSNFYHNVFSHYHAESLKNSLSQWLLSHKPLNGVRMVHNLPFLKHHEVFEGPVGSTVIFFVILD